MALTGNGARSLFRNHLSKCHLVRCILYNIDKVLPALLHIDVDKKAVEFQDADSVLVLGENKKKMMPVSIQEE